MFPAGVAFPAGAAGGDMMLTEMAPRSSPGDATPVCGSDSLPSFWMSHRGAGPGARGSPQLSLPGIGLTGQGYYSLALSPISGKGFLALLLRC